GRQFVDDLAQLLGHVDVAASTNPTGTTRLGGDWYLEYASGAIESELPFAVAGMQGLNHNLGCTFLNAYAYYGGNKVGYFAGGAYHSSMVSPNAVHADPWTNQTDFNNNSGLCSSSNTAPTFVTATPASLSVAQASSANDIKSLLHVSDSDAGQTETWSQSVAPSHGTLSFTNATANSGSADIPPGGAITYTPTASYVGSDSFTVQVSDSAATPGTATLVINVTVGSARTVTVNALTLNAMTAGTAFVSQSFSGAGGYGSYTYSVSAGSLPAGLSLNAGSGALTGTPTTAGAFNFTIQATDSSTGSGPYSGTLAFSGTVNAAVVNGACGTSSGSTFTSAPGANLCSTGTSTGVTSNTNTYTWGCIGSGGGTNDNTCSATRKYTQTITFAQPAVQTFGASPTLSASSDSNLTVTFSSGTAPVCTITGGGALTFVTAGNCTINADQAGDSTYTAASQVARTFAVNAVVPAQPTIGAATAGDTQASVAFTPGSTGGAAVTYSVTCTSSGTGATGSNTGGASPIVVTGLT
ncbi:MAG: DUF4347 domain-containing protein, partial [Nitrospirae bacterium]